MLKFNGTAFPLTGNPTVIEALPSELRDALQAWANEGNRSFDWDYRGQVLAEVVAAHIGEDVDYYNDAFGSVTPVHGIDFDGDRETPEEAALGSYSPNAEAFVVSTTMHNPWHATVVVDTVPSHPMTSDVPSDLRGRWTECSSGG